MFLFLTVNKDYFPILLRPVCLRNGGADLYRWKGDEDHCPLECDTFVERYKPFASRCCRHLQDKTDSESISLLY